MNPKSCNWLTLALAGLATVTITLSAAFAAEQVYDSTNPAGVWDTTTQNWDGSTAAWINGNDALFDDGTGIATVSPGIAVGEIVISSTAQSTIGGIGTSVYRFNGGSLDFGASPGVIDTLGTGLRNSQINSDLIGGGEATLMVEYNTDVGAAWESVTIGATSSGPDANGVTVDIDTAEDPHEVSVNIPASNAPGGKLFGRLKATKP